jgi:hypothetical protein
MKRSVLRLITRGVLVMLLLAQWSIVSHACTLASSRLQGGAGATLMADQAVAALASLGAEALALSDCASMEGMSAYTQDAICAEHCGYGDQGDRSAASAVPPIILSVAYFLNVAPAVCPPRRSSAEQAHALVLGSPPHAILHCVRRT